MLMTQGDLVMMLLTACIDQLINCLHNRNSFGFCHISVQTLHFCENNGLLYLRPRNQASLKTFRSVENHFSEKNRIKLRKWLDSLCLDSL